MATDGTGKESILLLHISGRCVANEAAARGRGRAGIGGKGKDGNSLAALEEGSGKKGRRRRGGNGGAEARSGQSCDWAGRQAAEVDAEGSRVVVRLALPQSGERGKRRRHRRRRQLLQRLREG
ncbi:hypothetical protein BHE74_00058068 [Ensete ventricosum]|nr:hypothetical protein GW17_00054258 [Ensete ventricosum]RWW36875.1 hypothetical protein BHE74_00058068 [Ensete ventricosum]